MELQLGGTVIAVSTLDAIAGYGLPAIRGEPFELAIGAEDTDAAVETMRAAGVPVWKRWVPSVTTLDARLSSPFLPPDMSSTLTDRPSFSARSCNRM